MGSSMDDNKEGISTGMLKALVVDSSCAMIPGLQLALDVTWWKSFPYGWVRRNQILLFLLEYGLENCHKCLGEKDRNLFKPQLWEFGSCMDGAMCREAERSPREDRQRTWRGSKGHGPTELFQAQAAEAGSDLRSKQTVLAWFSHAQGKG